MSEIESVAKINFKIVDGVVRVENAEDIADDQVVSAYLKFLEKRHACKPPATICFAKGKSP